jgi:hypothetical protein
MSALTNKITKGKPKLSPKDKMKVNTKTKRKLENTPKREVVGGKRG